jgi:hypothetical protein
MTTTKQVVQAVKNFVEMNGNGAAAKFGYLGNGMCTVFVDAKDAKTASKAMLAAAELVRSVGLRTFRAKHNGAKVWQLVDVPGVRTSFRFPATEKECEKYMRGHGINALN